MNLGIFHISDIHCEAEECAVDARLKQLSAYAIGAASRLDEIVWAITGDISNTGAPNEYSRFLKGFNLVVQGLEKRHPTIKQRVLVVPGNHDVNTDLESSIRSTTIKAVKSGVERNITSEHVKACTDALQPFTDAFTEISAENCGNTLIKRISHSVGDKSISFVLLNSAWLSEMKEKYGGLHFPSNVIQELEFGGASDVTVILIHHPVSWFDQDSQRLLRGALENADTICFFGHEHEPDARAIQPLALSGELPTIVIDGGVFQQKKLPDTSTFNLVELNLVDQKLRVTTVESKSDTYVETKSAEKSFKSGSSSLRKKTKLRLETLQWAEEHELQLFKGSVSNPSLRQLYVYPEADDVAEARASRGFDHIVRTRDLFSADQPALLFVGSEKSGKTALLKTFFGRLWASGLTPVYIGGEKIHKTTREHVSRAIDKAYRDQYDVDSKASWFSLPEASQILIVDDIDQSGISDNSFPELFETLAQLVPRFILSSTDMFNLEGPAFESLTGSPKRPRLLKLRHFGNTLRDELVLAWLRLDRPADITDDELLPEAEDLRKRLNHILCDDVVPRTPFFLLTILQGISETPTADLSRSALGYYYEFLLTNGLLKAGISTDQLTKYHSVFTELAFWLLTKGRTNLSEAELRTFFVKHVDEYELRLSLDQFIKIGQRARVLGPRDDVFCFYYSYQFLFYSGRALAKRLDSGEGLDLFRYLLARSFNIDIANIILFVAHHTRHHLVMGELLSICNSLFHNVMPIRFADDISEINQLVSDAPKIYASNKSTVQTRKERLSQMDRAEDEEAVQGEKFALLERREVQLTLDFEGEKTLTNVTGIERVNVAGKFVEIVGQALRNHHSEIPRAQKTEIIRTGTLLSLRSANHVIAEIAQDFARFVPQFSANLDPQKRIEFHTKFGRAAFSFLGMIACAFIKNISRSFGYEELKDTYTRVFDEEIWIPMDSESPTSTKDKLEISKAIVHLAIQLEGGGPLPFKKIQDLRMAVDGNILPEFILRFLIIDHLYMYPLSTQDKQRVYALLGIEVKTQQVLEALGKIEKT